jgi:hypothetical protein
MQVYIGVEMKIHLSVFAKMQKSRENGQIFAKFHEIHEYFLENPVYFSRKQKTPIFANILRKSRLF